MKLYIFRLFQENAEPQKTNAIFVKMENQSNDFDIMKYSCSSSSTAPNTTPNDDTNRLFSELSNLRQKHSDAIYELEKTKEIIVSLNNDKQRFLQTIAKNNATINSLSTQNSAFELRTVAAEKELNVWQNESNIWKDEKKNAALENAKYNGEKIDRLQKELKVLQARLHQNVHATEQNKRYFKQTSAQTIENSYEVKQLMAHRKRNNQREFLVQWTDTWEKESNLNCPKILKEYSKQHK